MLVCFRAVCSLAAACSLAASVLTFFGRYLAAALKGADRRLLWAQSWRVFTQWYARARRKFTCTRLLPVMLVCYMSLAIIASLKKRLSLQRNSDVTRSSHPHTALLAALHAIAADRLHAIAA